MAYMYKNREVQKLPRKVEYNGFLYNPLDLNTDQWTEIGLYNIMESAETVPDGKMRDTYQLVWKDSHKLYERVWSYADKPVDYSVSPRLIDGSRISLGTVERIEAAKTVDEFKAIFNEILLGRDVV